MEDYSEIAAKSLEMYIRLSYPMFIRGTHHKELIRKLEDVEAGKIKRLMVFMPPRHGKTMIASEFFPSWYLGRNPQQQIIFSTYSQGRANDVGRKVRNQMQDPLHFAIFPLSRLSPDSKAVNRFNMVGKGSYFAVGAGGPITGRGADIFIIDDPIKGREDADSPTMRNRLKEWFQSVAYTRLMPGGAVIIIQTRWHHEDLSGWLLTESEEDWDIISFPAIKDGNALWPEKYPLEKLEEIQKTLGSRNWTALYQQNPTPDEGGIFKRKWFRYYSRPSDGIVQCNGTPQKIRTLRTFITVDLAASLKTTADYTVIGVWGVDRKGQLLYLLDMFRGQIEGPDIIPTIKSLAMKWRPSFVGIEKAGFQLSIIQSARRQGLPVRELIPDRDKISRALTATALFEAGKIWFPETSSWISKVEEELLNFPQGAHDDTVDVVSYAAICVVNWLGGLTGGTREAIPVSETQNEPMENNKRKALDGMKPDIIRGGKRPRLW